MRALFEVDELFFPALFLQKGAHKIVHGNRPYKIALEIR